MWGPRTLTGRDGGWGLSPLSQLSVGLLRHPRREEAAPPSGPTGGWRVARRGAAGCRNMRGGTRPPLLRGQLLPFSWPAEPTGTARAPPSAPHTAEGQLHSHVTPPPTTGEEPCSLTPFLWAPHRLPPPQAVATLPVPSLPLDVPSQPSSGVTQEAPCEDRGTGRWGQGSHTAWGGGWRKRLATLSTE